MVTLPTSVFATDEERGKKDDDYKAGDNQFTGFNIIPHLRKRRVFALVIGCLVLWLFVHNIPTDLGPYDRRTGRRMPPSRQQQPWKKSSSYVHKGESPFIQQPAPQPPVQAPPEPEPPYEGAIKFYELGPSLKKYTANAKSAEVQRNVLFAAADIASASTLIALACQMASWKRNVVHIAFMGQDQASLDEIRTLNNVDEDTCDIWWHDARPDRAGKSSITRMETSVAGALRHFKKYLDPRVVITMDGENEEPYFTKASSKSLEQINIPHIQVPLNAVEKIGWMVRLDSNALQAWHSAGIDIMVSAPTHASASLIRLLKSLEKADYTGFFPPRLTIELPAELDARTSSFLQHFRWPPVTENQYRQPDQLNFRRRIKEQRTYEDEAAVRFVESFFPSSPLGPHVLILSPQAELSPVFFHYLKLHLLDLKYSADALGPSQNLFGISLESPSRHLNGSAVFEPILPHEEKATEPEPAPEVAENGGSEDTTTTAASHSEGKEKALTPDPFRWQAPNSNAALYFADKWMEAHSFLTMRHTAAHHPSTRSHHLQRSKFIGQASPAWTEYFLDLMLARGYFLHFPGLGSGISRVPELKSPPTALAIIHNELYQAPEEYSASSEGVEPRSFEDIASRLEDDYLDSHQSSHLQVENRLLENLSTLLPRLNPRRSLDKSHGKGTADTFYGVKDLDAGSASSLTPLASLPLLDHLGEPVSEAEIRERALQASVNYRQTAGGCTVDQSIDKVVEGGTAADLFCIIEQDEKYIDQPRAIEADAQVQPGQRHSPTSHPQPQPPPPAEAPIGARPAAPPPPAGPNRAEQVSRPSPKVVSEAEAAAAKARADAAEAKLEKAADAEARASASAQREAERQIEEHPERGPASERIKIVNLDDTMKERAAGLGLGGSTGGAGAGASKDTGAGAGTGSGKTRLEDSDKSDSENEYDAVRDTQSSNNAVIGGPGAHAAAEAAAKAALAPAQKAREQIEVLEEAEKLQNEAQVEAEVQGRVQAQVHDHPQAPKEGQRRAKQPEGAKEDIMERVEAFKEQRDEEEAEAARAAAATAAD